ncbi:MAG: ATP-binding region, ATPase-like:Histidine kinase N-terminal [Proteobacteria bacterium]|nr:ATP-binding region, ATPase-like:Histidine kinase N-terminal [Pseudomonadota bacterium]
MIRLPRRPKTLVITINLAVVLTVLVFFLVQLLYDRAGVLERTEKRLQHFTNLLAGHTERSFGGIDILLQELVIDLSQDRRDWQTWSEKQGWQYVAERHTRALSQLRDLILFDQTGRQRFSSNSFPTPDIKVSDRPYFKALQGGADKTIYGPFIGRYTGRYSYALAHRIKGDGNAFGGVAFAALESAYFHKFCWPNRLDDEFDAFLINAEQLVIASCRSADVSSQSPVIGRKVDAILGLDALAVNVGHFRSHGRFFAVVPLAGYPGLRIVSSLPEAAALKDWKHRLAEYGLFAGLVVFIVLSGAWLIWRQFKEQGQTTALLEIYRCDLEERVSAATNEIARQKEEAERASIAKSRFIAAASHDLRQPLHALSLFAADLQRQLSLGLTRDLDQLATQINLSIVSLKDVFDSLLDISRLDMGDIVPDVHSFRLQELFDRVYLVFRRTALSKRVSLQMRPTDFWVDSDIYLVERILSNLVSNAIRYTPTGGRVLVAARHRQGSIRIEVRDNGMGIAPENQNMIFEEFFQAENRERNPEKGLGLGLPIVQRLVETLKGKLELSSRPGGGSVFAVILPRGEPQSSGLANELNVTTLVFLAECPELAKIVELATAWGYRCKLEKNPEHLRNVRGQRPAIVFVPAEQVSLMRAQLPPEWPVVVVTAGSLVAGEGIFVLKAPIHPAKLRALLQQLQNTLLKSIL